MNEKHDLTEDQLEELDSAPIPADLQEELDATAGPDHEDGPEFQGFEDRTGDDGQGADPFVSPITESDVVGEISTDEDGYLKTDALPDAPDPEVIVVQDYNPANPDAEMAAPTKVLRQNGRRARKNEQNNLLDRTSIPASQAEAPSAEGEAGAYGDEHSSPAD